MKLFQGQTELYLVTDSPILEGRIFLSCIEAALKGGVRIIQLREKEESGRAFYEKALALRKLTRQYNATFIVNDRVDIALLSEADGVHIGQSDLPLSAVRQLMGEDKIIGVSTHTVEEAVQAEQDGADYVGVGAMFATNTKDDANAISQEMLHAITGAITLPIVAIGGINFDNLSQLDMDNIDGIAVVSAILGVEDIFGETKKWVQQLR